MLNKIIGYLQGSKAGQSTTKPKKKRALFKLVLFRSWELHFLVKAAETHFSYECAEYESEEEKAVLRLIAKLKRNAESQTKREQEADHA